MFAEKHTLGFLVCFARVTFYGTESIVAAEKCFRFIVDIIV